MPVWHASLALLDPRRGIPVPVSQWTVKDLSRARSKLGALLSGVGSGPDHWKGGRAAYHLRRRLSDAEIARLSPAWLALPAIDAE